MAEPIERRTFADLVAEFRTELAAGRRKPDIRGKPTYVQWAGFRLLWTIIGLVALLVGALLIHLAIETPDVSSFGDPITADSLALYQRASDIVFQRVTTLLDQLVLKSLLPILTLLLGYVFGARAGQASQSDEGEG